jgi:hypothetical protein
MNCFHLSCWFGFLDHVNLTCWPMCLWHVDFIYQLVFFIMSISLVDLFLCVMLTSLVDFMTFIISTQFVGLPSTMLDYVILAWFSRCSFSLVISVDQLPLHDESSSNKDIPSGASLFSPFGCNLVGSKLLCFDNSNDLSSNFYMDCSSFTTSWKTLFSRSHLVRT